MRPVVWERNPNLPAGPAAVLAALRLDEPRLEPLKALPESEWKRTLAFCDRAQLTLLLGALDPAALPVEVRERIGRNSAAARQRAARVDSEFAEIAGRLEAAGVEYLLLKGGSHAAGSWPDPGARVQYDIDIYAPQSALGAARDALLSLGYEPLQEMEGFPTDHLPAMIRKTGWHWRGDFFDPEIPAPVDLHFRFWDEATERIEMPGVDDLWSRRTRLPLNGRSIPVLHPADILGYAALHLLRHLLRGSARVYHVYELAWFLDAHAGDDAFWNEWHALHPPEMRRAEAVSFRLTWKWFGGRVPPAVTQAAEGLDDRVHLWMERHATAPVEALFRPNKAELWLHLSLLDSFRDQWLVAQRRLVPLRPPGPVDSVYVPESEMTLALRVRRKVKYAAHVAERIVHHIRALPPVARQGAFWLAGSSGWVEPFLTFLFAANTYNFGVFVFFILYNLHLLDLGFREQSLGLFAGAMTAGTIAAVLPAAALARRLGLRRNLILGCAGMALTSAARTLVSTELALLITAFLAGAFSAVWVVAMPPVIAHLVPQKQRPLGFSLWVGSGIATGIFGGLIASRLPGWVAGAGLAGNARAKQFSILTGCAIALLAVCPLLRLRLPAWPKRQRKVYPSGPFVYRFFLAFGIWQLAIGAFNPLFNAYFSRNLGFSVERIGMVFAVSQLLQAAAVFTAPWVLKKAGLIKGISAMQFATAVSLGCLAFVPSAGGAFLLYAAYMSFQVMSEPGIFSMLMNRVTPGEQTGASGLSFFVMFGCQAIAAVLGGWIAGRYGYPVMLAIGAAMAVASASLFRVLLSSAVPEAVPVASNIEVAEQRS